MKIKHKPGKVKNKIIAGPERVAIELKKHGKNIFPLDPRESTGKHGSCSYVLKEHFDPIIKSIKLHTLNPELYVKIINNHSIYIPEIRAFYKGVGIRFMILIDRVAKIHHIKYIYFATEQTNSKMIKLGYKMGFEPFARQGNFVYLGKDRHANFKKC